MSAGGEFGFIDYIKSCFGNTEGMLGIGDDCAVLPCGRVRGKGLLLPPTKAPFSVKREMIFSLSRLDIIGLIEFHG